MEEERRPSIGSAQPGGGVKDHRLFADIKALRTQKTWDPVAEKARTYNNSCCGRLAQDPYFEYITLAVIVLNALYLGYDCDYGARWGKPDDLYASSLWGFMLWDNGFCAFFTFEVVVRIIGYKSKLSMCKDKSFLFDFALVALMIVETWVLAFLGPIAALKQVSILRLLRLTRLLRMGKLLRFLPELELIVKGMLAAVRSVSCASALLLLVMYVFSIIFTSEFHQGPLADDDPDLPPISGLFGSMGKSMRHLLIMGTILDDITACFNTIRATDKMQYVFVFHVFIVLSAFTLFNMLVGILCEVMGQTADGERTHRTTKKITELMESFFEALDADGSGTISLQEFNEIDKDPEIMKALSKMDMEASELRKLAALLFVPRNDGDPAPALGHEEVIKVMLRLRPGTFMDKCDFAVFKHGTLKEHRDIDQYLDGCLDLLQQVDEAVEANEEAEAAHNENKIARLTGRAGNGKAGPTMASLADAFAAGDARPPPLGSKWQDAGSPQSGGPQNPRGALSPHRSGRLPANMVNDRVEYLSEKRRQMHNVRWTNMCDDNWQQTRTPKTEMTVHIPSDNALPPMPSLLTAVEQFAPYYDSSSGEEEERPPLLD